jgi:hypothetical protein
MITYIGPHQRNNFKKAVKTKLNKVKNIYLALFFIIPSTFLVFDYGIIDAHENITGDKVATCKLVDYDNQGYCSGFLISDDGLVITARHCVDEYNNEDVIYLNFDKTGKPEHLKLEANLIYLPSNKDDDYAVLKLVNPINIDPLTAEGRVKNPELYTPSVTIIGYPGGKDQVYDNTNNVRAYLLDADSTWFQTKEIYKGMSGGPVIDNKTGKVIGIVSKKTRLISGSGKNLIDEEGISYHEKIYQVFEDPKASHINW